MAKVTAPPRLVRLLGEFSVIVIGVLVALGADTWMKSGEDADRARAALTLMVQDLVTDSTRMAALVPYPPRHDTIRAVLWSTPSNAAISEDSVLVLLRRVLAMPDFAASRSTYESLVATDGIRHLGDVELGSELIQYYEERQVDVDIWHDVYIQAWYPMNDMIRRYRTPAPADFEEGLRAARVPQRLTASWRDIRQDDEFMGQLWTVAISEQNLDSYVGAALEANAQLLARVRVLATR